MQVHSRPSCSASSRQAGGFQAGSRGKPARSPALAALMPVSKLGQLLHCDPPPPVPRAHCHYPVRSIHSTYMHFPTSDKRRPQQERAVRLAAGGSAKRRLSAASSEAGSTGLPDRSRHQAPQATLFVSCARFTAVSASGFDRRISLAAEVQVTVASPAVHAWHLHVEKDCVERFVAGAAPTTSRPSSASVTVAPGFLQPKREKTLLRGAVLRDQEAAVRQLPRWLLSPITHSL